MKSERKFTLILLNIATNLLHIDFLIFVLIIRNEFFMEVSL